MKRNLEAIAKHAATEGIVLLKNEDNALPLRREAAVALVGEGCFDYTKGGLGSANVTSAYTVDLLQGLELAGADILSESKCKREEYTLDCCNELAERADTAIVMITRNAGEGHDSPVEWFYLSDRERALFDTLEKSSFKRVVAILNVAGVIDAATVAGYKKVKAVLLAWLPGMEGGSAIADLLYGNATPSGRLTDTVAYEYSDYPSAATFNTSACFVNYVEDVFVGYRYFETFARDRVAYPFGFGLSYTDFKYEGISFSVDGGKIRISLTVKNTGAYRGAEVVEVYSSSPTGEVMKPAVELRAFKKTRVIQPGESEALDIAFDINDMAYFDEERAAYILDAGLYSVYLGRNVRDLTFVGEYEQKSTVTVYQTTLKFLHGVPCKIGKDGRIVATRYWDPLPERGPLATAKSDSNKALLSTILCKNKLESEEKAEGISLYDVASGALSLPDFISRMTSDELIDLSMGQPPSLVRGTAGIGNNLRLGIVNAQTGDGPAGVRSTRPTICFPCATLLASTMNEELLFEVGKALARDSIANGVDILLAPGLNIHRNPLCGRAFEYYSEDPVVSGKSAAAIVRGVQSLGVGTAIKHFALNNKEENRKDSNSIASERAIREIYLKGFEIAVREGNPWCVMTSYNLINGARASANAGLIKGILREEWGYDGLVMTDWRVKSHLWEEIKAGSNLKMPGGYPEEIELARTFYRDNVITREELERSAEYVLKAVMKTRRFKERNLGKTQGLANFELLDFICLSTTWSGTCVEDDGAVSLSYVGLDRRMMEVFVDYRIENEVESDYYIKLTASAEHEGQVTEFYLNGERLTEITLCAPEYDVKKFFDFNSAPIKIPAGIHELRFTTRNAKSMDSVHYKRLKFILGREKM